ncbi:hypothetical protein A1O1_08980 [Capronia coronata CBS 617.96]|uniref:Uncharacterized protein n=1 Tax=Capronia coronata CBS 617.96 TaxID=1182541 RepID=W9Y851_9EURO|nr:uncharacterized protein A1O1_08980 [Capronia coronata CBS 617.96]EXJ78579.1 hypothetical protein A1O1_08980 [Capronia coronata CBS 617.96]
MAEGQSQTLERALVSPFYPALSVGVATGALGVAYGGIVSVLIQSPRPKTYTTLTGIQWFCGGTAFFCPFPTYVLRNKSDFFPDCRNALLAGPLSRDRGIERIAASGLAGACTGAVVSAFLPRGSIIPGSIMLGVFAAASQAVVNTMDDSTPDQSVSSGWKQKLAGLMPMKSLTDEEYGSLLQEKLLKLDVEIAILDDQIANLKAASQQQAQSQSGTPKDATT